jgi:hypothetical protein
MRSSSLRKKKVPLALKYTCLSLPLAGAAASVFLPLTDIAHQFMILVVLVWIQAYFIFEIFLVGK